MCGGLGATRQLVRMFQRRFPSHAAVDILLAPPPPPPPQPRPRPPWGRWAGVGRRSVLKQPSILDVVHGVKTVGAAHPEVTSWWYTPPQRLRLAGEMPGTGSATISIEVVV